MPSVADLYGGPLVPQVQAPSASSTPSTDLLPSSPSAIPNHYTPDQKYDNTAEKPTVSKEKHRWYYFLPIGVITYNASNAVQISAGLTVVAGPQTYKFTDPPKWCLVGVGTANGVGAVLKVWLGDGGGFYCYLNNGGVVAIPMVGEQSITIQALVQTINGTIIPCSGYEPGDFIFLPGNQP